MKNLKLDTPSFLYQKTKQMKCLLKGLSFQALRPSYGGRAGSTLGINFLTWGTYRGKKVAAEK